MSALHKSLLIEAIRYIFLFSPDTPKRLFLLHWLTWLVACTSVILLLISRGHYTVDVVLAYYVTTRVW